MYHDGFVDEIVVFNELGYWWKAKLKYSTHIILITDNAICKVFRDIETLIGSSKPKLEGAICVFFSIPRKTGFGILITVAKRLSPCHSKDSISLCIILSFLMLHSSEESKLLNKDSFQDFPSNRYGCLGELSSNP